jgi:hypothetical protein
MGVFSGPDISESGLVLALDGGNFKSFKGEATTNLIPSPTVNAYPTTGNGWGTYNTNQYGSGTYFSIGTVNDVTNNIITMTSAHSLRTYDVMQPQTTGGGVTAGTNYFIKKVSNTSFSLHAYNSSQDGSQGYINSATGTHKVYDSIATDTRISVNSSSFPTMWWGAPHLPNSGLVKELRYGEFNAIPNLTPNDCIRLHYIRTDDVKDGMSYGVDCSVTPGSPVTVSFYTRSANANAVGKVVQYYIYNYTGGSATAYAWNFTLGSVGEWQRQSFTYTPAYGTMISYWFPQSGGVYAWDWSCMQVEQKSYATSFVPGTRGATVATGGGWADLTGNTNHGTLVNGVRESSDNLGALIFDGTDDYVSAPNTSLVHRTSNWSYSCWVNFNGTPSLGTIFENGSWTSCLLIRFETNGITIYSMSSYWGKFTLTPTLNTWYKLDFIRNGNSIDFYLNGTYSQSLSFTADIQPSSNLFIGMSQHAAGQCFNGRITQASIYNRALTAAEVQQNFNANRSRFGI